MPQVTIERLDLSPDQVAGALREQLGHRYRIAVVDATDGCLRVETTTRSCAEVRMRTRSDGTHFSVHGGGAAIGRVVNEYAIARRVAAAIRRAPGLGGDA